METTAMAHKVSGRQKVPVSARAVLQRINRKLGKQDWPEKVCKARAYYDGDGRGPYPDPNMGEYYRVDIERNFLTYTHVNIEELGRELEVLAPYEALAEEEE